MRIVLDHHQRNRFGRLSAAGNFNIWPAAYPHPRAPKPIYEAFELKG